MWIPRDTAEIEAAIAAGTLDESPTFDAKRELSTNPKHNASLATDIAAMSTAGGVILLGVGEDAQKRLTIRNPITLAEVADRIAQIVQTSISEVPHIETRRYELPNDSSQGYLVIIIPPSPRAPHQVTVGDDRRFYGRGAKGNRRLSEQEISLLYARRHEQAVNLEARLREAVASSRFQPSPEDGYLYAFAQPVPPTSTLWDSAVAVSGSREQLQQRLVDAIIARPEVQGGHDPHLRWGTRWFPEGAEAWRLSSQYAQDLDRGLYVTEITMNIDGRAVLFSGNVARRVSLQPGVPDEQGRKYLNEAVAAANLAAFFAFMSSFFAAASYFGPVDCGALLTGINDSFSNGRYEGRDGFIIWGDTPHFNSDRYSQVRQLAAASELEDAEELALDLLRRLTETTTGRTDYDPFKPRT